MKKLVFNMRIAFNALSVSNLSGRHVLLGHARQILGASREGDRHLLLHHVGNRDLAESLEGQLDTYECPSLTGRWPVRWAWERKFLPKLMQTASVDVLFSPTGMTISGLKTPQISLAQNPSCFIPAARKGLTDEIKASLQRRAYRRAQRDAALMLFNSEYMESLYLKNAGFEPVNSLILHQGLDEDTFEAARDLPGFDERQCEVVTVSVMARHKNIEDVLRVLHKMHLNGMVARLKLVGPWPDIRYKALILRQIKALGLVNYVDLLGHVPREALYRYYTEARVFCLLSNCESFGIPAIEAEVFGTPAVVANSGGPPEIAGPGGVVVTLGDLSGAATTLGRLLTDKVAWTALSIRARENAERFRWESCTRPLIDYISETFA